MTILKCCVVKKVSYDCISLPTAFNAWSLPHLLIHYHKTISTIIYSLAIGFVLSCVSIAFIVIDCGHPGDIENGNVTFTTTNFGSTATYSCEDGYYLDQYSSRFCTQSGNWSGQVPTCVGE